VLHASAKSLRAMLLLRQEPEDIFQKHAPEHQPPLCPKPVSPFFFLHMWYHIFSKILQSILLFVHEKRVAVAFRLLSCFGYFLTELKRRKVNAMPLGEAHGFA
jgi:hypothetical protein